jgi:LPXTG-site transpeptidase (sortase) family protein
VVRRQNGSIIQKTLIIVMVPLVSLSATFLLLYKYAPRYNDSPEKGNHISNTALKVQSYSMPASLNVKKININAIVAPTGLTVEGDMDISENAQQLAWYKLGPKPGEKGSAVIAGHYGWKNGVPSVFNDLNSLIKGDEISVVGEDGRELTFVVTHTASYDPEQDATTVFTSKDKKAHLNLITCQGTWNKKSNTYSERLVVFTDFIK